MASRSVPEGCAGNQIRSPQRQLPANFANWR